MVLGESGGLFWVTPPPFFFFFFAVYSNALQESANSILYNGLIEELVDVLQITDKQLMVRSSLLPKINHPAPQKHNPHHAVLPPLPGHQGSFFADPHLHCASGANPKTQQHHRLYRHRFLSRFSSRVSPELYPSHDRWVHRNPKGGGPPNYFAGGLTHPNTLLPTPPDPSMEPYPHQFATALFSFLYHLASYDAGGEALVSCGMMEALLKVSMKPWEG